ncbi:hypothetical protein PsYK624_159690 [Phanerochaete sordida]|uniref:Uncharacterized protein n=1 Tax=Phanerochaete sordida TaxID=48140 RepID=A0A9P3GRF1_9APHY|nr:hypothetical protein PsYK624_159690 [Phanerochaete sordida]
MSSLGKKLKHSVSRSVLNVVQGTSCVESQTSRFSMDDSSSAPSTPRSATFSTLDGSSVKTADSSLASLPVLAPLNNFDSTLLDKQIRNRASLDRALDADPRAPKPSAALAPPPYHKPKVDESAFSRGPSTEQDRSSGKCLACQGYIYGGKTHVCPPKKA